MLFIMDMKIAPIVAGAIVIHHYLFNRMTSLGWYFFYSATVKLLTLFNEP